MIKKNLNDLVIFGGIPAFQNKLCVGCPNIGKRESFLRYVNGLLDKRLLTNNGPLVQEFEQRIARMLGVKHCIAVCNATTALEITERALELKGEVIVPSFTFIATAHSLKWQELTPIFCDIDANTHNIDPKKIEALITPRTSGIIGVHVWGRPCEVDELANIAKRHRLKLIFDAAHAFGCSSNGRMIGSFGDVEVLSFHATKVLNTFEGGAVLTNNGDLAKKIRLMKNFGFTDYDTVGYIGVNGKMSEISAAMGLTGLESLDDFVTVNARNYKDYQRQLSSFNGVSMALYNEKEKCNYNYIVLEIDETITRINRDQLVEVLWSENILARRYFYPGCHKQEPYRSSPPWAGLKLPETEKVSSRALLLPNGTTISPNNVLAVCQIIKLAINNSSEVCRKLADMSSTEKNKFGIC